MTIEAFIAFWQCSCKLIVSGIFCNVSFPVVQQLNMLLFCLSSEAILLLLWHLKWFSSFASLQKWRLIPKISESNLFVTFTYWLSHLLTMQIFKFMICNKKYLREKSFADLHGVVNSASCWRVGGISGALMLQIPVLSELFHLDGNWISGSHFLSTSSFLTV